MGAQFCSALSVKPFYFTESSAWNPAFAAGNMDVAEGAAACLCTSVLAGHHIQKTTATIAFDNFLI